jgi:peptidoglycan endopeptidase LytF
MHKLYILILAIFLANSTVSYASNPIDSIGVENYRGKKLIVHRVEAKETYYSIAKKYSVNYKEIMSFNDDKSLQIGVILKIPTTLPFITTVPEIVSGAVIEYTIKAKDNLNMLAERFGTTVDAIKNLNGLKSINLQIGQVLKIPTSQPATESNQPATTTAKTPEKTTAAEDNNAIEHTIKAKENLNLIAEKYGTTVDEIKRLNGLTSNNLRIGQVLKIKAGNNTTSTEAPIAPVVTTPVSKTPVKQDVVTPTVADGNFEHIVVAGETIYSIAKKYNQTTYQIKTANNLTSNEVTVGQKIIIKGPRSVAAANGDEEPANGNTIKDPSLRYAASSYGIIQVEEKGTAVWIADPDLDPSKMLVLHRTATVGTIIKVTNPMSNRSAFAKVVGKFTENESTKDVIIVMTKAVADAVGALDKRFFCNLTYGAQENEQ